MVPPTCWWSLISGSRPEVTYRAITTGSGVAPVSGVISFEMPQARPGEVWNVHRIVVSCSGLLVPQCNLYLGPPTDSALYDGTYAGNNDVSDLDRVLDLGAGQVMSVVFTGASLGALGAVRFWGDISGDSP